MYMLYDMHGGKGWTDGGRGGGRRPRCEEDEGSRFDIYLVQLIIISIIIIISSSSSSYDYYQ